MTPSGVDNPEAASHWAGPLGVDLKRKGAMERRTTNVQWSRRRLGAFLLVAAVSLSGCNVAHSIQDGMAKSKVAAEAISKECGAKPEIGFNYFNGSLASVTVHFKAIPGKSIAEIESASRKAVVEAFGAEPQNLVVAFVFQKN